MLFNKVLVHYERTLHKSEHRQQFIYYQHITFCHIIENPVTIAQLVY
jgi:hypothetical protein